MSLIHPTHAKIIAGSVVVAVLAVGGFFAYSKVSGGASDAPISEVDKQFPDRKSVLSPSVHKILKGGQDINGAFVVLAADLKAGVQVDSITPRYLRQLPAGWDIKEDYSLYSNASKAECSEINKKANIKTAPATLEDMRATPKIFGCLADGTSVFYKHTSL